MDASKVEAAAGLLSEELKNAIHAAYQNIYKFHEAQKQAPEKSKLPLALLVGVSRLVSKKLEYIFQGEQHHYFLRC
jgi:histidinol dehydrogenase